VLRAQSTLFFTRVFDTERPVIAPPSTTLSVTTTSRATISIPRPPSRAVRCGRGRRGQAGGDDRAHRAGHVLTVFDLFTFPITTGTLASISMAGSSSDWSSLTWFAPGQNGPGTFDYGASVWQSSWTTIGGESRKLLFHRSTGDVVVVPEPSTLVMAAVGLAVVAAVRCRRHGKG